MSALVNLNAVDHVVPQPIPLVERSEIGGSAVVDRGKGDAPAVGAYPHPSALVFPQAEDVVAGQAYSPVLGEVGYVFGTDRFPRRGEGSRGQPIQPVAGAEPVEVARIQEDAAHLLDDG